MANTDRANGFKYVSTKSGAVPTGRVRAVHSPASDRSSDTGNNHGDIYLRDPITISASGVVTPADSGEAVDGVVVGIGASDSVQFGGTGTTEAPSPAFDPSNLTKRYLAHSEEGWVYYIPTDDAVFEVQSDSDLDLKQGDLADITNTAGASHGDRDTGFSNCEITTDSNSDVRVVELRLAPDNDTTLANARYFVEFINRTTVAS